MEVVDSEKLESMEAADTEIGMQVADTEIGMQVTDTEQRQCTDKGSMAQDP